MAFQVINIHSTSPVSSKVRSMRWYRRLYLNGRPPKRRPPVSGMLRFSRFGLVCCAWDLLHRLPLSSGAGPNVQTPSTVRLFGNKSGSTAPYQPTSSLYSQAESNSWLLSSNFIKYISRNSLVAKCRTWKIQLVQLLASLCQKGIFFHTVSNRGGVSTLNMHQLYIGYYIGWATWRSNIFREQLRSSSVAAACTCRASATAGCRYAVVAGNTWEHDPCCHFPIYIDGYREKFCGCMSNSQNQYFQKKNISTVSTSHLWSSEWHKLIDKIQLTHQQWSFLQQSLTKPTKN